jgi:hypothetical protein
MAVTEVGRAARLDAALFSIPPAGYRRTTRTTSHASPFPRRAAALAHTAAASNPAAGQHPRVRAAGRQ